MSKKRKSKENYLLKEEWEEGTVITTIEITQGIIMQYRCQILGLFGRREDDGPTFGFEIGVNDCLISWAHVCLKEGCLSPDLVLPHTNLLSYWLNYGYWCDVGKSIVVLFIYDPCGPLLSNYSACMQAPGMLKCYELITSQGNWI